MFFGTPDWAVPSLQALIDSDIEVAAVVTNPDKPAGRGYELKAPPVKLAAEAAGLKVMQPPKARDPEFLEWFRAIGSDVAPVVAYGKLLPAEALAIPRLGFVNLHFSLLPAFRGAAPVQRAVMEGLEKTGISIMVLTEGMDEGPVIAASEVNIGPEETTGELGARLADIGGPLLVDALERYERGELTPVEQDHDKATYAAKIDNAEARIDWTEPAIKIHDLVRGLNPVPGAWTTLRGERLKIHRTQRVDGSGEAGMIVDPSGPAVATGSGALLLTEVQPAGKRPMSGSDFSRGARPGSDERFE